MRVLLTGSSGQIGTNLGLRLLNEGHDVVGIDIRVNPWTQKIRTHLVDLRAACPTITEALSRNGFSLNFDIVVHLAAHAKVYEVVRNPERAMDNIRMLFNVLEFCRDKRLPLVFSSSREVYGNFFHATTDETHGISAIAESPYSASKIAGEAFVHSYARCYNLRYLIFRLSNVYGRYDNDLQRMERVIPLFVHQISHRMPVTIYGQDKVLDFTFIDDCVDGIYRGIKFLVNGIGGNQTLNLAFGQGHTLLTVANFIGDYLKTAPDIRIEPAHIGEVTHYVANINKAKVLLGYQPGIPLSEGICRAAAWYLDWWKENAA
jgi:nucleoside-diphosphate-sugar epimerase